MNPKVNFYFEKDSKFKKEIESLREICLKSELEEDLKWGVPCYILDGKNVVLIHYFKEYCALLFTKGVLLKDEKKILIQQTEHVQSARQLRFATLDEIKNASTTIEKYIAEAIEIEKSGKKVVLKPTKEFDIPEELSEYFKQNKDLKTAFEKLTPGRQRAYLIFFSGAKQSKTRVDRIEKNVERILSGKGLND